MIIPLRRKILFSIGYNRKVHFNWDKYPELGKHATKENREKTRLLYPEIYEKIKDKNISVFYTDKEK